VQPDPVEQRTCPAVLDTRSNGADVVDGREPGQQPRILQHEAGRRRLV